MVMAATTEAGMGFSDIYILVKIRCKVAWFLVHVIEGSKLAFKRDVDFRCILCHVNQNDSLCTIVYHYFGR